MTLKNMDDKESPEGFNGTTVERVESAQHEIEVGGLHERFGYEQALPRTRGLFDMITMMLAMSAVPYGVGTTFYYSLHNGGSPVVIWDWLVTSVMAVAIAVSLGEIASQYPVSGGVYYWSFVLSKPKWAPAVAWVTGWLSLVGNIMVVLSINFGVASLILASVNIFNPEYIASPWHQVLTTWALIVVFGAVSILFQRYLSKIDAWGLLLIIIGVIATTVTLSVKAAAGRRSAADVFITLVDSGAGWPAGWSFMIGMLQGAYTYSATGLLASMAEEVKRPEINLPRGMVWGNIFNVAYGLIFILPMLFTLGDLETILGSATGQLLPEMYLLATASESAAFGLFFVVLLNGLMCCLACSQGAARCIWAFSRDGGIPGKHIFGKVSVKHELPLNAFLLCAGIQFALSCIYFGSSAAFNAFVSVAVICLGTSYIVPVVVSFLGGRKSIASAPWYRGKLGYVCNVIAIAWTFFSIPLYSFPVAYPVTAVSMNYGSVVYIFFALLSLAWYAVWGRKNFTGPPMIPV